MSLSKRWFEWKVESFKVESFKVESFKVESDKVESDKVESDLNFFEQFLTKLLTTDNQTPHHPSPITHHP